MSGVLGGLIGSFAASKNWAISSILPDSATRNYSQGVAFGAGNQFVMLRSIDSAPSDAASNSTLRSTNGLTWTAGTLPDAVRAIAGNGTTIVVAHRNTGGFSYYSTNGTTWTQSNTTSTVNNTVRDSYWSGDRFIAVAEGTAGFMTSSDGITWTSVGSQGITSVTNNGTTYVGILRSSNTRRISTDNGATWATGTLPANLSWSSIRYANGIYVAIANNSTNYATSSNGTTWTARTLPAAPGTNGNSGSLVRMGVVDGKFVYVATSTALYESNDGISWTLKSGPHALGVASTGFATNGTITIASLADSDYYMIYQ